MSSKKIVLSSCIAAAALIAVSAFGSTAANADPVSPPHTYVAAGSDTIQDLYNSFETSSNISSWNATLPGSSGDAALGSTITPVNGLAGTGNTIGRPNGSGDGRKALSAAWNPSSSVFTQVVTKTTGTTTTPYTVTSHSIDLARSSGKPTNLTADNLTSVPLARDAVTVATFGFSADFNRAQLEAIFGAPNDSTSGGSATAAAGTWHQAGSTHPSVFTVGDITRGTTPTAQPAIVTSVNGSGVVTGSTPLHVKLPQAFSGTRQFFQSALGNTLNTAATWVNQNNEENHADALTTTGDIIPFSAAQFVAQFNNVAPNTGVNGVNFHLDTIGGVAAATVSGTVASPGPLFGTLTAPPASGLGHFNRDVYSVVPSVVIEGSFANPTYDAAITTLVTSTLPGSGNVSSFGFDPISYSATSADWIHSAFEN
jgi:hypothetical protein